MSTTDELAEKELKSEKSEEVNEDIPAKVHSANSWETVDLGDDDRKKKFLRLMGAAKSEHQGRFIIGEKSLPAHKHARDKKQIEEIEHELEEQYKHTFEHRITKWSHKGLGFDDDKKEEKKDGATESSQLADNRQDTEKSSESQTVEQSARKRESTEPVKNPEVPQKKPKMMMNFVRASDS